MKKMMKKTFSLLMIFMLVFTMIPTSTLKVSAKAAAATTQAKKATTKTAKKDSKKEKKDKSKEAENCIYSGWTPAERNLFYRKISARFFQKKSKTDIWYCWCTYAYPRI